MYAVLTTGGKQYRVEAGSTLVVEKLGGEPGSSVTFDRVLLVGDGEKVTVGTPVVAGASVRATVLGEELGEKLVVFKFKQKVKYRRRTGHRQHLTRVHIDAISADGKTVTAELPAKAKKDKEPATPRSRTRRTTAAAAGDEAATEKKGAPARRRRTQAVAGEEKPASAEKAADAETAAKTKETKPRARAASAAKRSSGRTAGDKAAPAAKASKEAAAPTDTPADAPAKPRARRTRSKAEPAKEE